VGNPGRQGIHHHIARTGIKGNDLIQSASGREQGEVSDTADVLQCHSFGFAAVQQIFRVGHQRCPQPSRRHIPDAEIADHRAAEFLRQIGRVTDLQCTPEGSIQVGGFLRDVVNRLPVAADEIDPLCPGPFQQMPDRFGIEFPKVCAQQADLPGAAAVSAAQVQDSPAGGGIEALKIKAQLLHLRIQAAAGDPGQHRVDTIGGGAAHEPNHQPGRLVPKR